MKRAWTERAPHRALHAIRISVDHPSHPLALCLSLSLSPGLDSLEASSRNGPAPLPQTLFQLQGAPLVTVAALELDVVRARFLQVPLADHSPLADGELFRLVRHKGLPRDGPAAQIAEVNPLNCRGRVSRGVATEKTSSRRRAQEGKRQKDRPHARDGFRSLYLCPRGSLSTLGYPGSVRLVVGLSVR